MAESLFICAGCDTVYSILEGIPVNTTAGTEDWLCPRCFFRCYVRWHGEGGYE